MVKCFDCGSTYSMTDEVCCYDDFLDPEEIPVGDGLVTFNGEFLWEHSFHLNGDLLDDNGRRMAMA